MTRAIRHVRKTTATKVIAALAFLSALLVPQTALGASLLLKPAASPEAAFEKFLPPLPEIAAVRLAQSFHWTLRPEADTVTASLVWPHRGQVQHWTFAGGEGCPGDCRSRGNVGLAGM